MNPRKAGTLSMADVLDDQKRQTKLDMNCIKVGVIQSFNPSNQRAAIQIAYKQVKDILDDGTKVYQEYPVLLDCPVITLFGGVDIISLPVQAGDNCLVFFNDNEIDQWATNGTGNPQTFRMHDLSDAIAIVGIRPLSNVITNYLANGIRLSHGVGNSQMDLKDDLIETIAELFLHHGDMRVTGDVHIEGNLTIDGDTFGDGSQDINLHANLRQDPAYSIHAGNGWTGTAHIVTVVDGIVIGGSN